ncbi:MAG: AMP-binding protein, partial [Alkalispirochaeta sp.]
MKHETIPKMLRYIVATYPDTAAQMSRVNGGAFHPRSYQELQRAVHACAAGLQELGVKRGTHVGLVAENREEWFTADLAILSLGAADVPRGNDSTTEELAFILSVPECPVAIVENEAQLKKVMESVSAKKLPALKHLIIMEGEIPARPARGIAGHQFREVVAAGETALEKDATRIDREVDAGTGDEVATIIFTSGTTGEPKGVMLTHHNFLYQVQYVPERINATPGDIWLCVLPVWHSFERIVQYIALFTATTLAYSKPIGKIMLADMAEIRPKWMASVPRIWEAVRA